MPTSFPRMLLLKQRYPAAPVLDIDAQIAAFLAPVCQKLTPGARIGLAVGSRGITSLQTIVRAVIGSLKSAGTQPFIIPAMGSHGGATPEGQTELLAEYGISERQLGVPILAAMEVERVGTTDDGVEVFCSTEARRANGILLINRIKPHTDFGGKIGSGILKMTVIGLGKRVGAAHYHVAASRLGYEETLRRMARVTLGSAPILGGIGILENQRHETAHLAFLPLREMERREEELFQEAKRLMPKLPFDDIELLILDQIGKNISGSGMDPNVVGRSVHGYSAFLGQRDLPAPRIKRIFVRDLTAQTHGNAIGIGLADLTTTRLVEQMNRQVTYVNALTSLTPNCAKIPIYFATDREALGLGLNSLGLADLSQARVVRIADTLSLERLEVSEAYHPEMNGRRDLEIKREARDLRFDSNGNLAPLGESGP